MKAFAAAILAGAVVATKLTQEPTKSEVLGAFSDLSESDLDAMYEMYKKYGPPEMPTYSEV